MIEYLKKDRKVSEAFLEKLRKLGFEISYKTYNNYWTHQECIKIGKEIVWLVELCSSGNNTSSVGFKYQNEVIKEINYVMNKQLALLQEEDVLIETFFTKDYSSQLSFLNQARRADHTFISRLKKKVSRLFIKGLIVGQISLMFVLEEMRYLLL